MPGQLKKTMYRNPTMDNIGDRLTLNMAGKSCMQLRKWKSSARLIRFLRLIQNEIFL
jgi:hypothetical protein